MKKSATTAGLGCVALFRATPSRFSGLLPANFLAIGRAGAQELGSILATLLLLSWKRELGALGDRRRPSSGCTFAGARRARRWARQQRSGGTRPSSAGRRRPTSRRNGGSRRRGWVRRWSSLPSSARQPVARRAALGACRRRASGCTWVQPGLRRPPRGWRPERASDQRPRGQSGRFGSAWSGGWSCLPS